MHKHRRLRFAHDQLRSVLDLLIAHRKPVDHRIGRIVKPFNYLNKLCGRAEPVKNSHFVVALLRANESLLSIVIIRARMNQCSRKGRLGKVYYSLMSQTLNPHWRSYAIAIAAILLFSAVSSQAQPRRPARARKPAANFEFTTGHSAVIPFDLDGNSIVVQVRVNNSDPMKFFFDTGAAMSVVSTRVAESLKLKKIGDADVKGTGGNVAGSIAGGVSLS